MITKDLSTPQEGWVGSAGAVVLGASQGVDLPTPPQVRAPSDDALSPLLVKRQRGWELGLPAYIDLRGRTPPVIIAVGGGKGGVGKSLVSANLAVRLAATGRKVVAIDLDIGGSNLHTYFGVGAPKVNLADAVIYKQKSFAEVLTPTPVSGVQLVAGGKEEAWGGTGSIDRALLRSTFDAIMAAKDNGQADIVILDLGAGTHRHTIDFFSVAHLGMLTVLPEPTSIENAYLFLKTSLFRLIENVGERLGSTDTAADVKALLTAGDAGGGRATGYADKLRQAAATYPGFVSQVAMALAGRTIGVTINQVRCQKDIDVGRSMELIGERYFGFITRYCGYLNYDEAAWKSLRNRRLLVIDFPHSILSRRFSDLTRAVLSNLGF